MAYAPENTAPSFEEGWKRGADAVECDVHLSKDGRLVVMHDETLDRCTSGKGFIKDRPWAAIRRLDAGTWFHRKFKGVRPWLLKDLLAWARDKKSKTGAPLQVIVEIKNEPVRYAGIAEAVAALLSKEKFAERATVISFDHGAVKKIKRLNKKVRAGILFSHPLPDLAARMAATGADALFPRYTLVTPSLLKLARRRGWFVGTWTVNEPKDMKRLLRLGVDAVASNVPDRLARFLGR
jgi:glycerophosphoryl diester phosphodiesterase